MTKRKDKDFGMLPVEKPPRLSLLGWLRGRASAVVRLAICRADADAAAA